MKTCNLQEDFLHQLKIHDSPDLRTALKNLSTALSLHIEKEDMRDDLCFGQNIAEDFPEKDITTSKFIFLVLLLAVRHSKELPGYQSDIQIMPHIRSLHWKLKTERKITLGGQVDLCKWVIPTIDPHFNPKT